MLRSFFFLRKSKKIFEKLDRIYQHRAKTFSPLERERLSIALCALKKEIEKKDAVRALQLAEALKNEPSLSKTSFQRVRDSLFSLGVALLFAVIIRTMWFELYTIPTGSMRPTLKESDVLLVSKTDFGLNIPLKSSHFTFDPDLVKRGSIVVWGTGDMDIQDSDTHYFGIFPGKKIFVKRLMGKPGDTLYFYGGKIYGIDSKGTEIPPLNDLEHIPFIQFDGNVQPNRSRAGLSFTFRQMNLPIAKLSTNSFGLNRQETLSLNGRNPFSHYSDFSGMKNYAMARILTKSEVKALHPSLEKNSEQEMFLELNHHPCLKGARILQDETGKARPELALSTSIIPLDKTHIDLIATSMTTARFSVKNGFAYRLGFEEKHPFYSTHYPRFTNVPDGTYEFQNGKAFKVYPLGYTKELSLDHPLYSNDPLFVQTLYNLGIEFLDFYKPNKKNLNFPSRYSYFREGSLYLLGVPLFKKGERALIDFEKEEISRGESQGDGKTYLPFIDQGPPSVDLIRRFGVVVPERSYLMLGDNHAMSSDSRHFGFVPEENLKGSVSFLLSPFGPRWGRPIQPNMNYLGFPNLFVWISGTLLTVAYQIVKRRKEEKLIER